MSIIKIIIIKFGVLRQMQNTEQSYIMSLNSKSATSFSFTSGVEGWIYAFEISTLLIIYMAISNCFLSNNKTIHV